MASTERKRYERSYGHLYERDLDTAEIAKRMRTQTKVLVKAGMLPADWTYSVRTRRFAGGTAIDITATSPRPTRAGARDARDWTLNYETGEWVSPSASKATIEAAAVYKALDEIHNAYQHDGSEIETDYFDVNYYGSVSIYSTLDYRLLRHVCGPWAYALPALPAEVQA